MGLFTDALTDRENTPEKDLWAKGSHSKENIDGLGFEGGGLSLDTQYNGTVVGMDLYRKANTTAGATIACADGNSSSSDGGAYTKNDATYLGASLYGLKDLGGYRLAADLSYVGRGHPDALCRTLLSSSHHRQLHLDAAGLLRLLIS